MELDASVVAFDVVFGIFVVVTAVLIVLVVRFTLRSASAQRRRWLGQGGPDGAPHTPPPPERGLTALVLAGGGTRGAVQVGMLQALAEHGFVPDRIYGTSVGAVNGTAFAGDPTPTGVERMVEVWRGLTRDKVFPQRRVHGPWQFLQQREAVHPNSGLRDVIEAGIGYEDLEEAAVPVEVVATSLTDGSERWFTAGPAVEAVLASAAIPSIFQPVEIHGELLIDGGVVNNVPVRRAVDQGATRVVVLLCGPPVFSPPRSRRPVEAMVNALFISVHARFRYDMANLPEGVEVIVCPGGDYEASRDYADFSETEALIATGRAEALTMIRRYGLGRPPAAVTDPSTPATDPSDAGAPADATT